MEAAGAPTGPSLPGWSGAVPIGHTATSNTSAWKLGFTSLVSAGCAAFVAVVSLFGIGVLLWSNGVFSGPAERPVVQLVPTLEDANLALQRKNNPEALRLAGLALDDYPADPNANLTYGLALASSERAHLARPFLCAAKAQGLTNQLDALDCRRGHGAAAPLSPSIIMAQIDKTALLQALNTPAPFKSTTTKSSPSNPSATPTESTAGGAAPPAQNRIAVRKGSTTLAAA